MCESTLRGSDVTGLFFVFSREGLLVTIVTCRNVPSLLVFPRSNMQAELLDGALPGSVAARHKAGWIQKESFTLLFKHMRFVKVSKEDHTFLTLVGHSSHTRNIEVTDCAREGGVHVVCLPLTALTNCNLWVFPACSL
jgi:uncharacterized protein YbcC (UPF0753/DUF2309 family)